MKSADMQKNNVSGYSSEKENHLLLGTGLNASEDAKTYWEKPKGSFCFENYPFHTFFASFGIIKKCT